MDEMKWELLTSVQGRLEAELLKTYLGAYGIDVELFQEAVGHHVYPVTVDGLGYVELFVSKERAGAAHQLLDEYNQAKESKVKNTVILVTNNGLGNADEKLQQLLFTKYLELLLQHDELPAAICFYTNAVKLVCEGSPVIESLRALENKGVRLVICSTCLSYFNLADKVQVGIVGGMGDILEAQMKAEKVITL